MTTGINHETICNLADKYAREITRHPATDIESILRQLVIDAMEIGSNSAFEQMAQRLAKLPTE